MHATEIAIKLISYYLVKFRPSHLLLLYDVISVFLV